MHAIEVRNIAKDFGGVIAIDDVSFAVGKGEIVSLLGPSGCGKTTTLRLIAGLETPNAGHIFISGRDVVGWRPYERNVGVVFQDYALFPHMTVAENVGYGLRRRGSHRNEIPQLIAHWLGIVRLIGLEKRWPGELSGGQQQRVALARALATNPEVLLLDEPLAALDAKLRQELRVELKELLRSVGSTTIIVTHDQEEAMSLASRIIVMNQGQIEQEGTTGEIYNRPRTKFVAEFIGRSNWFQGVVAGDPSASVREFVAEKNITLLVAGIGACRGAGYEIGIRPERIHLSTARNLATNAEAAPMNRFIGRIRDVAHLGPELHVLVEIEGGIVVAVIEKYVGQGMPSEGDHVQLTFRPEDCIAISQK